MTISVGAQFDHYKIIALLGAGEMVEVYLVEVYLAEDTRLKRKVALKLLPNPMN